MHLNARYLARLILTRGEKMREEELLRRVQFREFREGKEQMLMYQYYKPNLLK